jgi:putative transposase
MPRKPRFFVAGLPVHLVQRGNNRAPTFFADEDRRKYLGWLGEAAERWDCALHAYVLMTNHVHLLMTPADDDGISRAMQYVGRRYVPHINRSRNRTGTLWEGRFKSSLVQTDAYLLACYRYIELNPVRAGLVAAPGDYPWSSYACNALGRDDPLLTPHDDYLGLGRSDDARRAAYRRLFEMALETGLIGEVRECLQTGTPLGDAGFRRQIERRLGRPVGFAKRGRPRKTAADDGGEEDQAAGEQLPGVDV